MVPGTISPTYNRIHLIEEVIEATGDRLAVKGEVYSGDVIY